MKNFITKIIGQNLGKKKIIYIPKVPEFSSSPEANEKLLKGIGKFCNIEYIIKAKENAPKRDLLLYEDNFLVSTIILYTIFLIMSNPKRILNDCLIAYKFFRSIFIKVQKKMKELLNNI